MFEREILEWQYPERYFVAEVGSELLPLSELVPMVSEQLKEQKYEPTGVTINSDPKYTYQFAIEGRRNIAFVDQYTGKVTGIYVYQEGFFYKMMSLHRWLMDDSRTWGKYTVGITTIIFIVILISGFFIWIPKDKKKWKSRFGINLRRGWKRFWYDIHIVLGFYAGLLLLLCSLTGLMWSFDWYRNGVYALFNVEVPKEEGRAQTGGGGRGGRSGEGEKEKKELNVICWDDILSDIQQKDPAFKTISIQDGSVSVLPGDAPHNRALDSYRFDVKLGNITKTTLYEETPESRRAMLWAYNLHVGAYGGIWTRILTCVACLIGASLPLTGYYLWLFKKNKKKKKKVKNVVEE